MRKYLLGIMSLIAVTTLAVAIPAFAQAGSTTNAPDGTNRPVSRGQGMMKPEVFGTVSAINGDTLTILGHSGFGKDTATTTFTVDATNAKVTKIMPQLTFQLSL
jgi:hypothetical protein